MTDPDLNYVTLADEEWELAPPDTPIAAVGDAMVQMDMQDKLDRLEKLRRKWERDTKLAERRRVDPPDPPAELVTLTNDLMVRYYRAVESMLALADDDDTDSELPSRGEFREAIGEHYRNKNKGQMTDSDLEEVMSVVREAWMARVEAATALPPESPSASASGPSSGRTGRSSKPRPASK